MNKTISTPLAIIIIGVLAVIVGGGVSVYQYKFTPKEPEFKPILPPKDETADWKTYRNEEHGFGIKYPNNWYVYDEDVTNIYFQEGKEEEIGFETQPFGPHSSAIKISVIENSSNLSAKELAIKETHNGVTIGSEEEIIVGKIKGIKIIPKCEDIYCEYPIVYVAKDLRAYRFDQQISGRLKIFEQILSTFRFLE